MLKILFGRRSSYGPENLGQAHYVAIWWGCRECLKDVGIPTIFSCDIPLEDISESWLCDVESAINDGRIDDISIYVPRVSAENIIGYEHPIMIKDPYMPGLSYRPNYKQLKKIGMSAGKDIL